MSEGVSEHDRKTPSGSSFHLWFLAVLVWLSVAGMLVSRGMGEQTLVTVLTLLASTSYLGIAALAGAHRSGYGVFVLLALICCWIGDVIGPIDFIWGLYAFLVAHLFLIAAFCRASVRRIDIVPAALVLAIVAAVLIVWFLPQVPGDELIDFIGYTVAISVMVVVAWAARRNNGWLLPAAVIFFVSDIFVARWKYGGGTINGYLCYPLYYTACIGFAMSIKTANLRCATTPVSRAAVPESPTPVGSSRRPPQS